MKSFRFRAPIALNFKTYDESWIHCWCRTSESDTSISSASRQLKNSSLRIVAANEWLESGFFSKMCIKIKSKPIICVQMYTGLFHWCVTRWLTRIRKKSERAPFPSEFLHMLHADTFCHIVIKWSRAPFFLSGALAKRLPNSSCICCADATLICSDLPSVCRQKGKSWQRNSSSAEWEECDHRISERIAAPHNTASNKIPTRIAFNSMHYRLFLEIRIVGNFHWYVNRRAYATMPTTYAFFTCRYVGNIQDAYHE